MTSFVPAFHPWFCMSTLKRKQADSDGTFPPSKRRRCNTLEHGLAGLSIASEPAVEEAVAPEIKMKTSSWYEPEPDRIVVTDLDSSDDEDGGTEVLTITPAYSKHIQTRIPRPLAGPPSGASQAVVLYQPVAPPPKREPVVVATADDDDAMDVC